MIGLFTLICCLVVCAVCCLFGFCLVCGVSLVVVRLILLFF